MPSSKRHEKKEALNWPPQLFVPKIRTCPYCLGWIQIISIQVICYVLWTCCH